MGKYAACGNGEICTLNQWKILCTVLKKIQSNTKPTEIDLKAKEGKAKSFRVNG